MLTVKDSFEINNKITVLVCDMFTDDVVTNTLQTNEGLFARNEFAVEKVKYCFGTPTTREIVIRKTNLTGKIKSVDFI